MTYHAPARDDTAMIPSTTESRPPSPPRALAMYPGEHDLRRGGMRGPESPFGMMSLSDHYQGESRAGQLDPEDPAVSETGSPVMGVVVAAGRMCHCQQAQGGYIRDSSGCPKKCQC